LSRAANADLEPLAVEDQHRGYICFDLMTGLVVPGHPLIRGCCAMALHPIAGRHRKSSLSIDILGMNFYPQWSVKQFYVTGVTGGVPSL
jgi:hypothetical protein